MKLDRRSFMKVGAATAAGATVMSYEPIFAAMNRRATAATPGEGEWKATLCQGCTSWCPMQAYVVDGRVIKVRGNPASRATLGKICPRPHLALQQMYDPDRVKTPLKRTNPRKGRNEDPKFVPISWDEAMDTIAEKIMELRRDEETHKFSLWRGRYTGLNSILYGSLPRIIGSPNNISHSAICAEGEKFGSYYTEGYWNYNDFDLENSRYVICFGVDPLMGNRQTPRFINVWSRLMDRAKIAVTEPRLSATAAKADEWLPVIPGEDGAIAVAVAHVILSEGRWYKPFVGDFNDGVNRFKVGEKVDEGSFTEKHTHGLVKWWNLELFDKTPEWAAERAGVPAEQIYRVARDFAAAAPKAIAWVSAGVGMWVRGAYAAQAIHALNGLVGSVDNEGGIFQHQGIPTASFPSINPYVDDLAKKHSAMAKIDQRGTLQYPAINRRSGGGVVTNRVADAILDEDPYDLKVVIGYWNNFVFSCSGTDRWEKAMEKIPFFASITTHPAETTMYADIVLPATVHLFERNAYITTKQNLHSYLVLQQRVVEPLWDVKSDETEIVWLLAEKLAARGFTNLLDWLKEFKDPETGKNPTNGREFEDIAVRTATYPLWSGQAADRGDDIRSWEEFKRLGVWHANRHPYRTRWDNFSTDTKKFEFYSETLKRVLGEHADKHGVSVDEVMRITKYTARGEVAFIPHYEPAYRWGDEKEYPLIFAEARSRLNREGRSQNSPWYYELKSCDPGDENWADVIKINPETAARFGLRNGDQIRVTSPTGKIEGKLKLWEGIRPDVVFKTFGQGHWAYGSVASLEFGKKPRGANNNDLLPPDYEYLSGSTARHGGVTRVKVEKI